jgi:diguanylate cyclase (GGDEF)-like protein
VTVSVGVASGQEAGETIDEIISRADRALYKAKRTGRDRVVEDCNEDTAQ